LPGGPGSPVMGESGEYRKQLRKERKEHARELRETLAHSRRLLDEARELLRRRGDQAGRPPSPREEEKK
jgi:hypothetical protein